MEEEKQAVEETKDKKPKSNLFTVRTRKYGNKTYTRNRHGFREFMRDEGLLGGRTRKSAARAKVHTPTAQELIEWSEWKAKWSEWKAEQKAKWSEWEAEQSEWEAEQSEWEAEQKAKKYQEVN